MSNKCTLKTKGAMTYKAKKIEINNNIPSKKLEIQDKIILEENEDVIFQKIEGIEIFDNAKRIILTDAANKIVVMYDYNSGKILKFIDTKNQGHEWLERFLEMKPVATVSFRDDLHYIPVSQFTKYGLTEFDKKLVSFQFWTPQIINNRILLSYIIHTYAVSDNERCNGLMNHTGFCFYDKELNFEKLIVAEVRNDSYIIPGSYNVLRDGDIISISSNFIYHEKDIMDSLVSVARYDSTGKLLGNIGYLPEKYANNNMAYEELWRPLITSIDDSIFIAYPRTSEIYAPGQKVRFSLQNLPFSNDSGMVLIYNYFRMTKVQQRRPDSKEIGRLLPLSIVYTFNSNGNYGVIILVFDEEHPMGFYYIAQEYDLSGKLLSQTMIHDEPENQIRNFYFDKYNNHLCLVKKSNKSGWTIEKRRWQ
jgi:hypothetical protein